MPDLILLDLRLPILSGHAVVQEVAAQGHLRHIPTMVVTGSQEPLDYLDVACVLRKPVTPDDLTEAVWRCLTSSSSPRTA
jgi:CheY-like chemotaxis protein